MTTDDPTTGGAREPTGSQAERTALAWNRTMVGLAAVIGLVAVHAAITGGGRIMVISVAALAALVFILSPLVARRMFVEASTVLRGGASTVRPSAMLTLCAATTVLGLIALIASVLPEGR